MIDEFLANDFERASSYTSGTLYSTSDCLINTSISSEWKEPNPFLLVDDDWNLFCCRNLVTFLVNLIIYSVGGCVHAATKTLAKLSKS
jgi:hypothetical protein